MTETPRTWTLWRTTDMRWTSGDNDDIGGPIEVVEKAPVDAERERLLDLLKRAYEMLGTAHLVETDWGPDGEEAERPDPRCGLCPVESDLEDCLREYGRLGKGS